MIFNVSFIIKRTIWAWFTIMSKASKHPWFLNDHAILLNAKSGFQILKSHSNIIFFNDDHTSFAVCKNAMIFYSEVYIQAT